MDQILCTQVLFDQLNIAYIEYKREDVKYFPWKTVPQIWYEGHFIGGYSELLEYTSKLNKVNLSLTNTKLQVEVEVEEDYNECLNCSG